MKDAKLHNHWHQDYFTPDNITFKFPNGKAPKKYKFTTIHVPGYCSRCKQRMVATYKIDIVTISSEGIVEGKLL